MPKLKQIDIRERAQVSSPEQVAADTVAQYQRNLETIVEKHTDMIQSAQSELASLIEESNLKVQDLAARMAAGGVVQEEGPESAWVAPDGGEPHLVLNPKAVLLFQRMLDGLAELLPEIEKLIRQRPGQR